VGQDVLMQTRNRRGPVVNGRRITPAGVAMLACMGVAVFMAVQIAPALSHIAARSMARRRPRSTRESPLDFFHPEPHHCVVEQPPQGGLERQGYAVVLVGGFAFVVSCFLPYLQIGDPALRSASLSRLVLGPQGTAVDYLGGLLFLFAGVGTICLLSLAGLGGRRRWTSFALIAVSAAWTLTRIGTLLNQSFGHREVGYWTLLISIMVVAGGTILVWVRARADSAREEGSVIPAPATE
jgi:hypothetical protein